MPFSLEFMRGEEATASLEQLDFESEGPELETLVLLPSPSTRAGDLLEFYKNEGDFTDYLIAQMVKTLTTPTCDGKVEITRVGEDYFDVTVTLGLATDPAYELEYRLPLKEAKKVFAVNVRM